MIYEEPLVAEDSQPVQLIESLDELTLDAQQENLASTLYFIPDEEFYKTVPALLARDVRVVILTNPLGSTNHPNFEKLDKQAIQLTNLDSRE